MGARVLLVGNGAREHATAWKLRQSLRVDEIFIAPGNAGTATVGTNIPVTARDIDGLRRAAKDHRIDFYLASSDDPQPLGLVDRLTAQGVLCYGPTAAAARLESSKAWAKDFMFRNGIRNATGQIFDDYRTAAQHVESLPDGPMVVKASGLAAGKGVIVCNSQHEALDALDIIMLRRDFGSAGDVVVVEERLEGWETSAHAFCDGKTAVLMPFASDYKRAGTGDIGLNTGGMGAYSPTEQVDSGMAATIKMEIVDRVMSGMAAIGAPYVGTLYPGLMVTEAGIYVIEFNARSGDPETQVLYPRLESDLFEVCEAASEGRLHEVDVRWSSQVAVGVVVASGGYPATYKMGHIIEGVEDIDPDVLVFHAGTKRDQRGLVTNGGRVLTVVALADTFAEARKRAYDNVRRVKFMDAQYRTDIALRAVS